MYLTKREGVMTREGMLWFGLRRRTRIGGDVQSKKPCYVGCTMSESFKNFQYFASWCNGQIGYAARDERGRRFCLDKDIVVPGNKLYSEDTCVFVPSALNLFFTNRKKSQGEYLPGVCWHKRDSVFTSQCNNGESKLVHLGYFRNELDAYNEYKKFKEALARSLAVKWSGMVDARVVEVLNNYTVRGG